jgi:hypothetical protein
VRGGTRQNDRHFREDASREPFQARGRPHPLPGLSRAPQRTVALSRAPRLLLPRYELRVARHAVDRVAGGSTAGDHREPTKHPQKPSWRPHRTPIGVRRD